MSSKKESKMFFYGVGWALVVVGIMFILVWWPQVVLLFKSTIGMVLALVGLLVLYSQQQK